MKDCVRVELNIPLYADVFISHYTYAYVTLYFIFFFWISQNYRKTFQSLHQKEFLQDHFGIVSKLVIDENGTKLEQKGNFEI